MSELDSTELCQGRGKWKQWEPDHQLFNSCWGEKSRICLERYSSLWLAHWILSNPNELVYFLNKNQANVSHMLHMRHPQTFLLPDGWSLYMHNGNMMMIKQGNEHNLGYLLTECEESRLSIIIAYYLFSNVLFKQHIQWNVFVCVCFWGISLTKLTNVSKFIY